MCAWVLNNVWVWNRVTFVLSLFCAWGGGLFTGTAWLWILSHKALIREEKAGCFFFSLTSPSLSVSQPTFCLSPWKAVERKWKVQSGEVSRECCNRLEVGLMNHTVVMTQGMGSYNVTYLKVWSVNWCNISNVQYSSAKSGWQWLMARCD